MSREIWLPATGGAVKPPTRFGQAPPGHHQAGYYAVVPPCQAQREPAPAQVAGACPTICGGERPGHVPSIHSCHVRFLTRWQNPLACDFETSWLVAALWRTGHRSGYGAPAPWTAERAFHPIYSAVVDRSDSPPDDCRSADHPSPRPGSLSSQSPGSTNSVLRRMPR